MLKAFLPCFLCFRIEEFVHNTKTDNPNHLSPLGVNEGRVNKMGGGIFFILCWSHFGFIF